MIDTPSTVPFEAALVRPEHRYDLPPMGGLTVAVTGADGFIGERVYLGIVGRARYVYGCDLPSTNVLDSTTLPDADWCIHLAAHKYATTAEDDPAQVAELNIVGTQNVVDKYGPNVVLASTCKAADPMTVYGASKLIAERIVLNAGGRVVRFVNVLGSSGSVAQMWAATPEGEPLKVCAALRMWMTPAEAAGIITAAMGWPSGRYAPDVPLSERVSVIAERLYPQREWEYVPLRRGDRQRERLTAEYERVEPFAPGVVRIIHPFD